MGGRLGRRGGRALALLAALVWVAAAVPRAALAAPPATGTFKPAANVTGTIWTYGPGFTYPELSSSAWGMPELQRRPSFGIALSGGGYRATTLALGWVRALHSIGAMERARYLASNSGGSWLNGAYSFTQVPSETFLGPYLPPRALSRKALRAANGPGSYGRAVQEGTIVLDALDSALANVLSDKDDGQAVGAWSDSVGEAFLDPFGVGGHKSPPTALGTAGGVAEAVARANPGIPFVVACATPDKPFPIIMGSILVPEAPTQYAPIEFTPLYAGFPASVNGTDPPVGGGYVEPLLLNTLPPSPPRPAGRAFSPPPASGVVSADPDPYVVPLVTVVGISSSFASQGLRPTSDAAAELTGTEQLWYWSPVDFQGSRRKFADGGGADNLAVTPLVRRRVERIIACVAASAAPDTNASDYARTQWDIAGLFGAVPPTAVNKRGTINGMPVGLFNNFTQIFPREGFDQLYAAISSAHKAGKSAVHRARYPVLDNPAKAVAGGWQVEVLWVINAQIREWEKALPIESQDLIDDNRRGQPPKLSDRLAGLKAFPYVSTFQADYSPELVTLLSQQATWQLLQARKDVEELMKGAAPAPTKAG
ncbi:hypothetical protein Rsub_07637 [Raphidocelis subcapitata]|uniref:Uncharacterized protein n=1 Tax=Raphidocelis subcapitata TaxID=307507 RepID=A0A2V0P4G2_9CHLO|nr:hypothetical protein Rsub_07637 [Raphidocelis subcapitata]|eukprot:GBF94754.1 hypothetical protein Rsub_07637 [Raphidocelis subcapitata]